MTLRICACPPHAVVNPWVGAQRWRPEEVVADAVEVADPVVDVWGQRVLRHGDQLDTAALLPAEMARTHGNTYTVRGMMRAGFKEVGGHAMAPSDIDGSRRGLRPILPLPR